GPSLDAGVVVRLLRGAMVAVAVVGRPHGTALAAALDGITPMTPVVAQEDNAAHVGRLLKEVGSPHDRQGWSAGRMPFHTLAPPAAFAAARAGGVDPFADGRRRARPSAVGPSSRDHPRAVRFPDRRGIRRRLAGVVLLRMFHE